MFIVQPSILLISNISASNYYVYGCFIFSQLILFELKRKQQQNHNIIKPNGENYYTIEEHERYKRVHLFEKLEHIKYIRWSNSQTMQVNSAK